MSEGSGRGNKLKNGSRLFLDPFCIFTRYFLLRRWWRVLRNNLRCFFLDMRLRRFLITEPTRFSFCFLVRARRSYYPEVFFSPYYTTT